jgi:prophage regulatory protein
MRRKEVFVQVGTRPRQDNPGEAARPAFMRLWEVLSVLPVSKSTFYAGVKSGRYPKPVKLGPRISAWRVEEIDDLVKHPR